MRLGRGSRVLVITGGPAGPGGDPPLRLRDEEAAVSLLRRFADEAGLSALRAFLAREQPGLHVHHLADGDVLREVGRLLAAGRALAWIEITSGAVAGGGRREEGDRADSAPPSSARAPVTPRTWVEILLTDMEKNPLPGVRYSITTPDGSVREGRLDDKGLARVDGIDPGTCSVTFPDFDEEAWERA